MDAASRGWFESHDEVIPSLRAVAVPLSIPGRVPAAVAVVYLASTREPAAVAARLARSAAVIRSALGA